MIIKQAYIGILDTASDGEGNSDIPILENQA